MPHFIVAPQNTVESSKKIFYMGKNFKLTTFEAENSVRIFLGGHSNIYCLEGFVYKDSARDNSYIDKRVGELVQVYYDQACSLDGDFEKGIDTRNLIHLFLSIVKNDFPHVTRIHLIDASSKMCDNGSEVSLSNMLYARRGKTWYEQHFNATLSVDFTKQFDSASRRFNNIKNTLSWNDFKTFIKGDIPFDMEEIYNASNTWQQFFGLVASGDVAFCEFVSPWLDDFIQTTLRFSFSMCAYHIPLITYRSRLYSVLPFNSGGRRKTIRRGRLEKRKRGSRALE